MGEGGQITAFMVVMVVAVIVCAGLVLDGGRMLAGAREANNAASAAARVGAEQITRTGLYGGQNQLDPSAAIAAADAYLARHGYHGSAQVTGNQITVTVHLKIHPLLLGAFGLGDRTATGTATAQPISGVTGPGT